MSKVHFQRQKIDDGDKTAEHVRVYHLRVHLGGATMPAISGCLQEISGLCYIHEQRVTVQKNHEAATDTLQALLVTTERTEHPLIDMVRTITGVEHVLPFAYSVVVVKGHMFDWSEIEPSLLRLFSTFSLELPSESVEGSPVRKWGTA